MGQSQVCRESAGTPSLPSCGAGDGREWDAEDTPMPAELHQGSGAGSCCAARVRGDRSTIQRCSGGSTGHRQTLLNPARN